MVLPVPLAKIGRQVTEPERAQRRRPAGPSRLGGSPRHYLGRDRVDRPQVPGQPVLVQPGLATDRGQARALPRPVRYQGPDVAVSEPLRRRRRDDREAPSRPVFVRLGYRRGRVSRPRWAAFLRRCGGKDRPLAAAAASAVSSPALALARPVALPSRIAGSNSSRALKAAARSLRVCSLSSDWPRSGQRPRSRDPSSSRASSGGPRPSGTTARKGATITFAGNLRAAFADLVGVNLFRGTARGPDRRRGPAR